MIKDFTEIPKFIGDKSIYMFIGHGSKNQIKNPDKLNEKLSKMMKDIKQNSVILYFGDGVNKEKPDIGYVFQLLSKHKEPKNLTFVMIQIESAKDWGVPGFVDAVFWHTDFEKGDNEWGGVNKKGEPQSNTKKWIDLHKIKPISKIFVLGGGQITLEEIKLAIQHNIKYEYYPIIRKYIGDGKTEVSASMSRKYKYGVVDEMFCRKCMKVKHRRTTIKGGKRKSTKKSTKKPTKKSTKKKSKTSTSAVDLRTKYPKLFGDKKKMNNAKSYLRKIYGNKLKNMSSSAKDSLLYQIMIH